MKLYYQEEDYTLYEGNMLDMLEVIQPNSIDSIVCDPPYELNFMNKGWDNSGIAFQKETWEKCYQVLKPGAYLLAFGGTRTFHRIACAIEDAGFEIRDTIMYLYGSGFPKSMALDKAIEGKLTTGNANKTQFHKLNGEQETKHHYGFTTKNKEMGIRPKDYTTEGESNSYLRQLNATTELAKQYKGWGTALKPAYEPIIVARKPFKSSLVDNVLKYGTGGLNIDECRVPYGNETDNRIGTDAVNTSKCGFWKKEGNSGEVQMYKDNGRFPANIIHDGSEESISGMPDTKSLQTKQNDNRENKGNSMFIDGVHNSNNSYNDEGSASRYFYCAKASKKDRDDGLIAFEEKTAGERTNRKEGSAGINAYAGATGKAKNFHPTVKPVELMQYLVRLVSPKGATILDCFMGSGSTGKAVMFENRERNANYKFIGIELTEEYLPICRARIDYGKNKYDYDIKQEQIEDMQELGYSQTSIFDL